MCVHAEREGKKLRGRESTCTCTKMSGIYMEDALREGQPSPWTVKFRVGGRVCQVGTEECWENLEARSALIGKIRTPVPCPGVTTKYYYEQVPHTESRGECDGEYYV